MTRREVLSSVLCVPLAVSLVGVKEQRQSFCFHCLISHLRSRDSKSNSHLVAKEIIKLCDRHEMDLFTAHDGRNIFDVFDKDGRPLAMWSVIFIKQCTESEAKIIWADIESRNLDKDAA